MDHIPHVRFVDAHSKRDCRDDCVDGLRFECLLVSSTFLVGHTGVVRQRAVSHRVELIGQLFGTCSGCRVDDAGFTRVALQDFSDLRDATIDPLTAVNKIRTVKRTDEHFRVTQAELFNNVSADVLGGGRGEGMNADVRKVIPQRS